MHSYLIYHAPKEMFFHAQGAINRAASSPTTSCLSGFVLPLLLYTYLSIS
jgi:hypothetical protein